MDNKNFLSILFLSFDKFSDVLPVTYHFFQKNYSECNFNVYWGSNGGKIVDFHKIAPKWSLIHNSNYDKGWSQNLKSYLENISTKYVLIILDDFLILNKPDEEKIFKALKLMEEFQAHYCRLNPNPSADIKINDHFGFIKYYSTYRTSLQPSIWNRKELLNIVSKYELDPWQFEHKAGITNENINEVFLGVFTDIIHAYHCIEKGKWLSSYKELFHEEGLNINYNKRGTCNLKIKKYSDTKETSLFNLLKNKIKFHRRKLLKKNIFNTELKIIKYD
ncbi:MAG: hypothetical protein GQ570_14330 [Helicobacteraceae bacterium]|nr:hypothetical protein [Helicobacteraceae bacterium]